ncbi:MAG: bifunctional 4-hydroxy-3-methylbut-2-enyl diphosphate reductase/30S ribosomal protein S1 [Clostridia bacterium]|nr:bifunctional 4-hydroxy-3-methylbut-2-enyl diphosphate reductase/30S ribosomal protein S1 [Clostridia bacterium]
MSIKIAKTAGFCFGVRRAVETVEQLVADKEPARRIYTLGKLIHNPHVIAKLEAAGVGVLSEETLFDTVLTADKTSPVTVVIRAHGTLRPVMEKLTALAAENPYLSVVDCTCPFVKKIHTIVDEKTTPEHTLIVSGDPKHPEVCGIVSYAKGEIAVIPSVEEADLCKFTNKNCLLVAQTTQKLAEWNKCKLFFKNHCTNADFFDTICIATENRQSEADTLSKEVDLMVVIGGRESSNTRALYTVARRNLANTVLIEDASELDPALIRAAHKIGITAGASTPSDIIEEVYTTMSEIIESMENFETLLEGSLKTLNTGDIVKGVITSISSTEVHVDLSANVTGIIPAEELAGSEFKVGDEIEAFVVRVSDIEGVAGLSRKRIERIGDWKKVVEAAETGAVLEGKVTEVIKGGVMLAVGAVKVFVPASQTGVPKDGDMKVLVGTTQKCTIMEISEGRNRAVASIKSVLRKERKEAIAKFWETLEVGQVFTGTVKSLTSYGAFVDLGGVDGMVHITELSWSRLKNPAEVVSVGDTLTVFVKGFDAEKKRISLGYKTDATNPWNIFMNTYSVGDVASVKIVNLTPFGAFAEIVPEVDGLIHISQLAEKRVGAPSDVVSVGDVVDAKIIGIDEEKQKVSLSIRALTEDVAEEDDAE